MILRAKTQLLARRRGLSLVEGAIVLGLVGLVVGAIWVTVSTVRERFLMQRTIEQISFIVSCVRETFGPTDTDTEPTRALRDLGCLPPDSVRRNFSAGWMISTAYWPKVAVGIDGDGELRLSFFSSTAEGLLRPGQCNYITQSVANAFGTSGEVLARIRTTGSSVFILPPEFPYAAMPNKCGDYPRFYFKIPEKS